MTFTTIWRDEARQSLSRLRATDPTSTERALAVARELAKDPYPPSSAALGGSTFRRLKADDVRITYRIDEANQTVEIYLVGTLPRARRPT
jgi:mRNA-degrading endonuclease RelE of RelBE toxin-antitoxin system